MRNASIRLGGVLLVGLLLGGSTARADLIDWSYHWSISPTPVLASGTGTVAEALYRGGSTGGSHNILAAAVTTSSSAMARDPDRFNSSFNLTLHLTDAQSDKSGALTFHGTIVGTLSQHSADLTESFRVPTESITLGRHTYTVTLSRSLWLMAPGSSFIPNVVASVNVKQAIIPLPQLQPTTASLGFNPASVQPAPEPSSFALAGVGVVLLGCVVSRRCRRLSVAAA